MWREKPHPRFFMKYRVMSMEMNAPIVAPMNHAHTSALALLVTTAVIIGFSNPAGAA